MKDHELRAVVLQKYYDLRERGYFQWFEVELDEHFPIKKFSDLARICKQLAEHGLVEWNPMLGGDGQPVGGGGEITAFGVDVIEGTATSPITITFDHSQTVSINGSNNIVGDHNSTNVDEINTAINHSSFSAAEKAEAKSLLTKVSENKLLNTVIGAAVGELTKAALPK